MVFAGLKVRFFEALDREDGNVSAAARRVGVNGNTAFRWVRQAGVQGRGKSGRAEHSGRGRYEELRSSGISRREAAREVGVHLRTAQDWDGGIRKIVGARLHPDGRRIDYKTGITTFVTAAQRPSLARIESTLHPRI